MKAAFNSCRLPHVAHAVIGGTGIVIACIAVLAAVGLIEPMSTQSSKSPLGIDVAYVAPINPKYTAVMEGLKARRVLEQMSEFAAPLRLPHAFHLITRECHEENAFYSPSEWSLTLCSSTRSTATRPSPTS